MQFKHAPAAVSAVFDDPNLVSAADLGPGAAARAAGGARLARAGAVERSDRQGLQRWCEGDGAGGGDACRCGLDRFHEPAPPRRHGAPVSPDVCPVDAGIILREFQFGHVRQLDAVASRVLQRLAFRAPLLQVRDSERVMVDIDDTIIEVHG